MVTKGNTEEMSEDHSSIEDQSGKKSLEVNPDFSAGLMYVVVSAGSGSTCWSNARFYFSPIFSIFLELRITKLSAHRCSGNNSSLG